VARAAAAGDAEALAEVEAHLIAGASRLTDQGRPSTGQDIVKGRRTEIDFLNGLVTSRGDEAGVPAPTHRAVVEVVKAVEAGSLEPSPALVEKVWELAR
jgi:2-dehydropantoate 2-reductase